MPLQAHFHGVAALIAAFGLSSSPIVQAQDHAALDEVVVTATPLRAAPVDALQPVAVLQGQRLVEDRAMSLGETLAKMPGVTSSWFGPQSSRPVIRGLGGERVRIYEDSVEALDVSSLSNDHAVTIDPLAADRIEVVRGPATLLYGNGAAGGAINVITHRIPSKPSEHPFDGAVELRGDDATGELAGSARADASWNDWAFHADGFLRDTEDVAIPGYAWSRRVREQAQAAGEQFSDVRGTLENTASETQGGAFGLSRIARAGHGGIAVNRFETEYGVPGIDEQVSIDMRQTRYDASGEWREPLRGITALRARATYSDYEHSEIEDDGAVGTRFEQTGTDARLVLDHAPLAGFAGTLGVQIRDTDFTAIGEEAYVPPSRTRNLGVFAYESLPVGPVTFELGARLESQEIELDAGSGLPDYDADNVNVAGGALWKFSPSYALALNLTSTERHPTATELYAEGPHLAVQRFEIGTADLGRERGRTIDLGLRRTAGAVTFTLSAFYNDYSGYIFPGGTGLEEDGLPVFVYDQRDARFSGAEAELQFPALRALGGDLEVSVLGDYVRASFEGGGDLPQIPPLRLGTEIAWSRASLGTRLSVNWYDAQDRVADNELPTDSYTLVDLDLSYRLPLGGSPLLLFVKGSNLLDEDARRHSSPLKDYAPLPGRSIGAGVRLTLR